MALRAIQQVRASRPAPQFVSSTRVSAHLSWYIHYNVCPFPLQENDTRLARQPAAKAFLQKPEVRPRAALGSIGNNVLERHQPGKAKVNQFILVVNSQ